MSVRVEKRKHERTESEDAYELLFRGQGVRIGTFWIEDEGPREKVMEIDLFLHEGVDLPEELSSLVMKLTRMVDMGFEISLEQEIGLTCTKRVGEDRAGEELERIIMALSPEKEGVA